MKTRPLVRDMLDTNDSFIVLCPAEIFVWIGAKASSAERKNGMIYAQRFLNGGEGKKRPKWTPITRVTQGAEPTAFTCKFKEWDPVNVDIEATRRGVLLMKGLSQGKNVAGKIAQPSPTELATEMTISQRDMAERVKKAQRSAGGKLRSASEGTLVVYRIFNFKKVELSAQTHGLFYAGDCYIVMFTYFDERNKKCIDLYFWLGRLSSSDEKGSAALLTRELDEEHDGIATQVRVVQNNEPEKFIALFDGKMVVRDGGLDKAGNDTRDLDGVGLFHIKGQSKDTVRTVQVVESATSLNSSDCFVLETPGTVHIWLGSLSSDDERRVGKTVGDAMAARLKYNAESTDAVAEAKAAAEAKEAAEAAAAAKVDEDGDGIPDVAKALMLMVDADGDGISDGLHAEKLGLFLPQAELMNERPFYRNDVNEKLLLWWSGGKWWLGKSDELGRNRGWLKVESKAVVPPKTGWLVYNKKDKAWELMDGMVAVQAQRIALSGKSSDEKVDDKFAGEFVKRAEMHEGRPVFVREGRASLMLWWNSGRWWLGKRAEVGTNRGWVKCTSDAQMPTEDNLLWSYYAMEEKKWTGAESMRCTLCVEKRDDVLPAPAKLPPPAALPKQRTVWEVRCCEEGEEPPEFWQAIHGKKPYEGGKAPSCEGGFEPRLFYCSDETGAFKVEEELDFSQEDLEHEDVYILDTWLTTFVWSGKDAKESEKTFAMQVADEYVKAQRLLDGRPADVTAQLVLMGHEPRSFTAHFVGWSATQVGEFEDPYEKRQKMLQRQASMKEEEGAESIVVAEKSDLMKELIKKTSERNGGAPPPVAAVSNGEITPRASSGGMPTIAKLNLSAIPGVSEASTLDSARRRANAAMAAKSSLAGGAESETYLDPQTNQFTADEIRSKETKGINPLCKELYLKDCEFMNVFGTDKDKFWKQPQWKQREAKRKAGLY